MKNKTEKTEIIVLGAPGSGKTSLIDAITNKGFSDYQESSSKDEIVDHNILYEGKTYATQFLNYKNTHRIKYAQCHIYLITFSLTDYRSYSFAAEEIIRNIRKENPNAVITLVGTKLDLEYDIRVVSGIPQALEKLGNLTYIEASAKDKKNLAQVTASIAKNINAINLIKTRNKLIGQLELYCDAIELQKSDDNIDFEKGFKTFKSAQGRSRHANFLLAQELIKELKTDKPINEIFSNGNIKDIRSNKAATTGIKLSFFGKNTVRGRVKDIIEEAQSSFKK